MSFAPLIDEVSQACEDELGDAASITDGDITLPSVAGFFRNQWDERLSQTYGFTHEAPSFECRLAALSSLDLDLSSDTFRLTFNATTYRVMSLHRDRQLHVLLVLSR